MKTSNLGNVGIGNSGVKRSPTPLSRNVYTSAGFGEIQPLQVLEVEADSKTTFSVENKTLLEPVVCQTYGHCKLDFWHYFVEFEDLYENYPQFKVQTPVTRSGGTFVPTNKPQVPHNLLSTLLLWGADMTVYDVTIDSVGEHHYNCPIVDSTSAANAFLSFLDSVFIKLKMGSDFSTSFENNNCTYLGGQSLMALDARLFIDLFYPNSDVETLLKARSFWIPLNATSNTRMNAWSDFRPNENYNPTVDFTGFGWQMVTPDGADFLIERKYRDVDDSEKYVAFAFRMSAFGRRVYKLFKGSELQEDFTDSSYVDLSPLFAVWKAYYECFGLLEYTNFENTNLKKFLTLYDNYKDAYEFIWGFADSVTSNLGSGNTVEHIGSQIDLLIDLGSMWVTDSQDFVSSMTNNAGVAVGQTAPSSFLKTFAEAGIPSPAVQQGNSTDPTDEPSNLYNPHAYINRVIHGQLDSELLKQLYQRVNVNTIAGHRVEELLRSQGFGKWVDACKPRFIGFDETNIMFDQITSQSDTAKDGDGMILGERGGQGNGYMMGKSHFYHNDKKGFIITLFAVVPDSGYVNTMSPSFRELTRWDEFIPDFDGKGYQAVLTENVSAERPVSVHEPDNGSYNIVALGLKTFGFAPRDSFRKVRNNIMSGKFGMRSVRDGYIPFTMDKVIRTGDVSTNRIKDEVTGVLSNLKVKQYDVVNYFPVKELALASLSWRFPTRYPWIGLFTRIFAAIGDNPQGRSAVYNALTSKFLKAYEYLNREQDGFNLLNVIRCTSNVHWLPITDSYETREDGNKGEIDHNISKA